MYLLRVVDIEIHIGGIDRSPDFYLMFQIEEKKLEGSELNPKAHLSFKNLCSKELDLKIKRRG